MFSTSSEVSCCFSRDYGVSVLCGVAPVHFSLSFVPEVGVLPILEIVALSVLCALLSIVFCRVMKGTHRYLERWIPNAYLRIAAGGLCVALLTVALGTHDYNGAGMDVIARAIGGQARPWDFIVKLVFTAITIGAGFRGGEIVPTFFVGATFGCVAGGLIGIDPGFGAAVGLVATFCGVVNCPIASIFLSLELFGQGGILFFAIACAVSYMLSGYCGLYSSQKIMYSKITAEYIDIHAR